MKVVFEQDSYVASTWGHAEHFKAGEPKEVGKDFGVLCLRTTIALMSLCSGKIFDKMPWNGLKPMGAKSLLLLGSDFNFQPI